MEPVVELRNVTRVFKLPHLKTYTLKSYIVHFDKMRRYDILYALKDVSLDVYRGQFVGLIGKNGSGKSTLLRLIAGILPPTSGSVRVRGEVSPMIELGIGFNGDLSARENIVLYSSILGISRKKAYETIPEILAFAELEDFIDAPLKTFSSGMHTRLAFAVAIASEAPILLVDEVLAVGDMAFQKKCLGVIDQFKRAGRTIIFVSHGLDLVSRYCDVVHYLKRGEQVHSGDADEMIALYRKDA